MTEFGEAWWRFVRDAGMVATTGGVLGMLVGILAVKAGLSDEEARTWAVGTAAVVVVLGFFVFFVNAMNGVSA